MNRLRVPLRNMLEMKEQFLNNEIEREVLDFGLYKEDELDGKRIVERLESYVPDMGNHLFTHYKQLIMSRGFINFEGELLNAMLWFEGVLQGDWVELHREGFNRIMKNYSSNFNCTREWLEHENIEAISEVIDYIVYAFEIGKIQDADVAFNSVAEIVMDPEFSPEVIASIVTELSFLIDEEENEGVFLKIAELILEIAKLDEEIKGDVLIKVKNIKGREGRTGPKG